MRNKLMFGLWRYVINVPPFLWQKQVAAGKRRFEKVSGALSRENRRIHHFVVKKLPEMGVPISQKVISDSLGISVDVVNSGLDFLEKQMTFLYRNKSGKVTWAYPVTVDKTPHRISFDTGEKLYAA